jgi:iron complex transport system ATP-binding protein
MRDNLSLRALNVRGGYGKSEVVHGISFSIDAGDVLCILGPNGCGKSTLLKLLQRLLPKSGGSVYYRNEDVDNMSRKRLAQCFSYIPQSSLMAFPYSALEMVTMARTSHLAIFETVKQKDVDVAMDCLERLKICDIASLRYNELSGGQRQLILIARALCQGACIMFMDEPTSSLDFANQQLINNAIKMIAGEGKIVVISTHSPSQPFEIASKALLLSGGRMAGFGSPDETLTADSLMAVYGMPMEVISVIDKNSEQRKICLSV